MRVELAAWELGCRLDCICDFLGPLWSWPWLNVVPDVEFPLYFMSIQPLLAWVVWDSPVPSLFSLELIWRLPVIPLLPWCLLLRLLLPTTDIFIPTFWEDSGMGPQPTSSSSGLFIFLYWIWMLPLVAVPLPPIGFSCWFIMVLTRVLPEGPWPVAAFCRFAVRLTDAVEVVMLENPWALILEFIDCEAAWRLCCLLAWLIWYFLTSVRFGFAKCS